MLVRALQEHFEVAGGSVTGRDHVRAGRNNQDAYHWLCLPQAIIAVVCDGCGSSAHSEVGAQLGARLVTAALARALPASSGAFWPRVHAEVLQRLRKLAEYMGGDSAHTVHDYLLFTVLGALLTPTCTWVFSLGDGVIVVNGETIPLGPFPHNAPPYLAYALLDTPERPTRLASPFQQHRIMPTAAVQSIVLGTDGLEALLQAETQCLPGQRGPVGPVRQFWQEARYFSNADAVRRTLTLANREVLRPDWEAQRLDRQGGLLPDDTTLVVIRRRPSAGEEVGCGRVS